MYDFVLFLSTFCMMSSSTIPHHHRTAYISNSSESGLFLSARMYDIVVAMLGAHLVSVALRFEFLPR